MLANLQKKMRAGETELQHAFVKNRACGLFSAAGVFWTGATTYNDQPTKTAGQPSCLSTGAQSGLPEADCNITPKDMVDEQAQE